MEIPEKLKLNHFLLAGACQSVAALHVDVTPETIKPLKPVVVALSKMRNEKKSAFKSNFSLTVLLLPSTSFFCMFFIHLSH